MFWDKKPAPQPDLAHLKVQDAQVRDNLSVTGAAEDFSDLDFTVDRREVYEVGSASRFELSGMWRDRRVFLEVNVGDNIEVIGNFDGRTLTLDDFGLTEDDMGELDQRQNQSDFLDFEGKFWLYRFSRDMGVFYCWRFQEQGGTRFLNVRKYENEPFTAAVYVKVEPNDVTVFRGA
jgi:hypothetical protein